MDAITGIRIQYIVKCGCKKGRNVLHRSMHCCGCSQHNLSSKHLERLDLSARLPAIFLTSNPSISLTVARKSHLSSFLVTLKLLWQKSSRFSVTILFCLFFCAWSAKFPMFHSRMGQRVSAIALPLICARTEADEGDEGTTSDLILVTGRVDSDRQLHRTFRRRALLIGIRYTDTEGCDSLSEPHNDVDKFLNLLVGELLYTLSSSGSEPALMGMRLADMVSHIRCIWLPKRRYHGHERR